MTLPLCFETKSLGPYRTLEVGSRWRLGPEHDPITNPWADVIITKADGAGYYCISPAAAYLARREGDIIPERCMPRLDCNGYRPVLRGDDPQRAS